jgi:hypothetical protein
MAEEKKGLFRRFFGGGAPKPVEPEPAGLRLPSRRSRQSLNLLHLSLPSPQKRWSLPRLWKRPRRSRSSPRLPSPSSRWKRWKRSRSSSRSRQLKPRLKPRANPRPSLSRRRRPSSSRRRVSPSNRKRCSQSSRNPRPSRRERPDSSPLLPSARPCPRTRAKAELVPAPARRPVALVERAFGRHRLRLHQAQARRRDAAGPRRRADPRRSRPRRPPCASPRRLPKPLRQGRSTARGPHHHGRPKCEKC